MEARPISPVWHKRCPALTLLHLACALKGSARRACLGLVCGGRPPLCVVSGAVHYIHPQPNCCRPEPPGAEASTNCSLQSADCCPSVYSYHWVYGIALYSIEERVADHAATPRR